MGFSWGKVFGALFVCGGVLALFIAAETILDQHRLLGAGQAVEAEVIATGVRERMHRQRRGADWTGYTPWARYRYEVGGRTFECDRIRALPIGFAAYYSILRSNIADATLYVSRDVFALDGPIEVVLNQQPKQRLEVEKIELKLIHEMTVETRGRKGKSESTRDVWSERKVLRERSTLQPRQAIKLPARFELPPDLDPTTPHGRSGYPRYAWRFDLRVSIANSPDYRATFPIFVARGKPPETPA